MPRWPKTRPLTRKEGEALDAIVRLRHSSGAGPTLRALAQALGITKTAISCRLRRPVALGVVTRDSERLGTLRVVEPYHVDAAGHVTPLVASDVRPPAAPDLSNGRPCHDPVLTAAGRQDVRRPGALGSRAHLNR